MKQNRLPEKDRRFVTTLARGLGVLRAFRAGDDGLGNAELAERTGLPKSTVSRLTFTLQSLGYLNHLGRRDRYRPGPALLALGNLASASMSFVDVSAPLMQRLADETGTMSTLVVRDDRKLLLVKTWRPVGVPSLWLEVGHRVPFAGSSSGHALLAALSSKRFASVVEQVEGGQGLTASRAAAIRTGAREQLLSTGFVVADPAEYFTPNIHAASVPFQPSDLGEPVLFSCGAVPKDLTLARLYRQVGPALRASVSELEQRLGQDPVLIEPAGNPSRPARGTRSA